VTWRLLLLPPPHFAGAGLWDEGTLGRTSPLPARRRPTGLRYLLFFCLFIVSAIPAVLPLFCHTVPVRGSCIPACHALYRGICRYRAEHRRFIFLPSCPGWILPFTVYGCYSCVPGSTILRIFGTCRLLPFLLPCCNGLVYVYARRRLLRFVLAWLLYNTPLLYAFAHTTHTIIPPACAVFFCGIPVDTSGCQQ